MRKEISPYIVADSEICHGKPTFKGTRVMVHTVLEMLENRATEQEILAAYPLLNKGHIKAALDFAVKLAEKYTVLSA